MHSPVPGPFGRSRDGASPDEPLAFLKGHGTENDFVLVPDRDGSLEITADQVRALCDRRAGIGGDGLLRIAPSADGERFFMDYRNADGSLAEMCGNGARVFAKFLYDVGWVEPGPFTFDTRGGRRSAESLADGRIRVSMGPATVGAPARTRVRLVDGSWRSFDGVAVDVGNPHLVVDVDLPLAELDLTVAPEFDAAQFAHGVNIEFVAPVQPGVVAMRVHERGVGETRSCGTGTVAVAAARLAAVGSTSGSIEVRPPGGAVTVDVGSADSTLTGPAVIVGSGQIDAQWWSTR